MIMKARLRARGRLALCALAILLAQPSSAADDLATALREGKLSIDVRYRFEHVDQEGIANDANAHTLRTRVGFETADLHDFRLGVELESVLGLGDERYNDTVNGKTGFPVVADPENFEANQYYIVNTSLPETTIKLGRQRMAFDNHRFVGTVGFRQNEQTFDALRISSGVVDDVNATYAYVTLVNRIFGEDSRVGDFQTNSHLVNLSYAGLSFGKITAYGYLIDIDEAPALSSKTFGLRFAGKQSLSDAWSLLYTAEAAWQTDHADNPNDDSHGYFLIEPGVSFDGFSAKAGYEILTSNGRRAFQTPLATLHAFQGWADKFLTTPVTGMEDIYLRLDYTVSGAEWLDGTKLTALHHWFSAEQGSADYGTEIDFQISRKLFEHFTVALKYAHYDAEAFATDTDKLWLTVSFKY